jgi:hypothetical protein
VAPADLTTPTPCPSCAKATRTTPGGLCTNCAERKQVPVLPGPTSGPEPESLSDLFINALASATGLLVALLPGGVVVALALLVLDAGLLVALALGVGASAVLWLAPLLLA